VRGRVEDVLVGGGAGAGLAVHPPRIARRSCGVIGGAWPPRDGRRFG
jgi:hypothetical protein